MNDFLRYLRGLFFLFVMSGVFMGFLVQNGFAEKVTKVHHSLVAKAANDVRFITYTIDVAPCSPEVRIFLDGKLLNQIDCEQRSIKLDPKKHQLIEVMYGEAYYYSIVSKAVESQKVDFEKYQAGHAAEFIVNLQGLEIFPFGTLYSSWVDTLTITDGCLKSLPDQMFGNKLYSEKATDKFSWRALNFENNCLTEIPVKLYDQIRLEWLTLSHNKIRSIDRRIQNLTSISNLVLDHNEITAIDQLDLPNGYVDLSYNNIEKFNLKHKGSFSYLNLAFNPLKQVFFNSAIQIERLVISCDQEIIVKGALKEKQVKKITLISKDGNTRKKCH